MFGVMTLGVKENSAPSSEVGTSEDLMLWVPSKSPLKWLLWQLLRYSKLGRLTVFGSLESSQEKQLMFVSNAMRSIKEPPMHFERHELHGNLMKGYESGEQREEAK